MQKLLILITTIASFFLASCSSDPVANRLPWVYRINVQQGNVISQDKVNQLRTGMTRRQVQFVMGAPMLQDPFHADRWDYVYLYKPGSSPQTKAGQERVTLFFREDRLERIEGSMQPDPQNTSRPNPQVTITVPPQERDDPGVLTRMWRWMGFDKD